jgi:hypothetical protein
MTLFGEKKRKSGNCSGSSVMPRLSLPQSSFLTPMPDPYARTTLPKLPPVPSRRRMRPSALAPEAADPPPRMVIE